MMDKMKDMKTKKRTLKKEEKKESETEYVIRAENVDYTDMTVKQYIDSVVKVVGAPIEITRYVRFETGEGMEKKDENFAEEVAKAMN